MTFTKMDYNNTLSYKFDRLIISTRTSDKFTLTCPLSPQQLECAMDLLHESQGFPTDDDSSCDVVHECEVDNEYMNYEEANEPYDSQPSIEAAINDPHVAKFMSEFSNCDINFQKTYYYDGANACYSVPLRDDDNMQPSLQNIICALESWLAAKLSQKLSNIGETIPIVEESPQASAEDIMTDLRRVLYSFCDLSKVLINIQVGHVYLLHMIGGEIVMTLRDQLFSQQFPFFVKVSIKVKADHPAARRNTCQVLVAVEHVTMNGGDVKSVLTPCKSMRSINGRNASSADGKIFCQLEEMTSTANVHEYFYGAGAGYMGKIIALN